MADSYVPIFFDWPEATRALSAQEKGRLIDAIVLYARQLAGREACNDADVNAWAEVLRGNERFAFPIFQAQIDRARADREAKLAADRANGKKGGRPRKNPPVIPETPGGGGVIHETQDKKENQYDDQYQNDHEKEGRGMEEEDEPLTSGARGALERGILDRWRRDFGATPTPASVRCLVDWARRLGYDRPEFVDEAISAAAMRNASDPVGYVIALFKDWRSRGIDDAAEIE